MGVECFTPESIEYFGEEAFYAIVTGPNKTAIISKFTLDFIKRKDCLFFDPYAPKLSPSEKGPSLEETPILRLCIWNEESGSYRVGWICT